MIEGTWTKSEELKLIKLRGEGETAKEIAKTLNRKVTSVNNKARTLDAPIQSNVDEEFFLRNDEYSNYVLGYWVADGCIMKKSGGHYFSIVSKDKDHLLTIKDIMEVRTKLYKNSHGAFEIRVGNKELVNTLIGLGGQYNKTFTISLDNVEYSKDNFRHFLRGYFDGDGSIMTSNHVKKDGTKSSSAINFTGGEKLIKSVQEHIGLESSLRRDERKEDVYQLYYYGNEMRELLDYMYLDSSISLERKYNTYLSGRLKHEGVQKSKRDNGQCP